MKGIVRIAIAITVLFLSTEALQLLGGLKVAKVQTGELVDIGESINNLKGDTMLVLGTYAADFNAVEYAQRLRYYLPKLQEKGVVNFLMVMNAEPQAAKTLAKLTGLPDEVQLLSDPFGEVGRAFGVSRGWRPDDLTNPYVKLFGMLWGLGALATLPSVIGGYLGNPWAPQPWIEDAMAFGQVSGRWPNNALELDEDTKAVKVNKFSELPYVGGWGRRPLELATLRLQNMLGISLGNWRELKPSEEALAKGVLTQLGGCVVVGEGGVVKYQWRDDGICDVANFESILRKL